MKIKTLILFSYFFVASEINADTIKNDIASSDALINFKHQKQLALALAPIKSKLALELLAQQESPLDLLSDKAKQRFVDSVVFTDEGSIGGYYYADLEAELTPTQIHSILSLIGVQHTVPKLKNSRIETQTDMLLMLTPEPLSTPSY
ncbi:hypothetical protein [uncultured Psychrosphaera sp.]|jgi:hypothetical protein|uniref:hypothetical protein n=1 Tax=uncultured Psychrosphaera sp. TaxID=1403522 RepID=UPI002606E1CE|nr:hypothetical protein [uncultured Psychrosphaera sp.]